MPLIVQRGFELIDERDVGSTRRFVAVSLKKKKKSCYSNEVSVGVSFSFFFFFLAERETMAKTRETRCAHSLQLSVEKYDGWENGNDGEINCARMGARKKEGMRIYNE